MKKIMLFLCLAALLLPVGCKKSEIETDILTVSISQNEMPPETSAFFKGYMQRQSKDIYNVQSRASSGYVTGDATFRDEFVHIYTAPENKTGYRILVNVSAHVYKDEMSTTKSAQAFILPENEEESKNYYIDSADGWLKEIDSIEYQNIRMIIEGEGYYIKQIKFVKGIKIRFIVGES